MRIPHRDAREGKRPPRRSDSTVFHETRLVISEGVCGQVNRYILRFENRMTHINGGKGQLVVLVHLKADRLRTRQRVGYEGAIACKHEPAVYEVLCKATNTIAAHLRKRAICVDVVHICSTLGAFRRAHHNHAIRADTEMTIAQQGDLLLRQLDISRKIIDENEVIAKTMKLNKIQFHEVLRTLL